MQLDVLAPAVPVENRTGTLDTGAVAWPSVVRRVTCQLNVTPFDDHDFPFNDPAQTITVEFYASPVAIPNASLSSGDWYKVAAPVFHGSADGVWGRSGTQPQHGWTATGMTPRWFRAVISNQGTITYGASLLMSAR